MQRECGWSHVFRVSLCSDVCSPPPTPVHDELELVLASRQHSHVCKVVSAAVHSLVLSPVGESTRDVDISAPMLPSARGNHSMYTPEATNGPRKRHQDPCHLATKRKQVGVAAKQWNTGAQAKHHERDRQAVAHLNTAGTMSSLTNRLSPSNTVLSGNSATAGAIPASGAGGGRATPGPLRPKRSRNSFTIKTRERQQPRRAQQFRNTKTRLTTQARAVHPLLASHTGRQAHLPSRAS
jgi:hypothetical protein